MIQASLLLKSLNFRLLHLSELELHQSTEVSFRICFWRPYCEPILILLILRSNLAFKLTSSNHLLDLFWIQRRGWSFHKWTSVKQSQLFKVPRNHSLKDSRDCFQLLVASLIHWVLLETLGESQPTLEAFQLQKDEWRLLQMYPCSNFSVISRSRKLDQLLFGSAYW